MSHHLAVLEGETMLTAYGLDWMATQGFKAFWIMVSGVSGVIFGGCIYLTYTIITTVLK